jgi:hypothetical protein
VAGLKPAGCIPKQNLPSHLAHLVLVPGSEVLLPQDAQPCLQFLTLHRLFHANLQVCSSPHLDKSPRPDLHLSQASRRSHPSHPPANFYTSIHPSLPSLSSSLRTSAFHHTVLHPQNRLSEQLDPCSLLRLCGSFSHSKRSGFKSSIGGPKGPGPHPLMSPPSHTLLYPSPTSCLPPYEAQFPQMQSEKFGPADP